MPPWGHLAPSPAAAAKVTWYHGLEAEKLACWCQYGEQLPPHPSNDFVSHSLIVIPNVKLQAKFSPDVECENHCFCSISRSHFPSDSDHRTWELTRKSTSKTTLLYKQPVPEHRLSCSIFLCHPHTLWHSFVNGVLESLASDLQKYLWNRQILRSSSKLLTQNLWAESWNLVYEKVSLVIIRHTKFYGSFSLYH